MARLPQTLAQEVIADPGVSDLLLPRIAFQCLSPLLTWASYPAMEAIVLTACSPMSAYKQNDLQGCMCLNHWGSVSSSDLATTSPWTDDTKVHILQPDEFCNPSSALNWPFCRAQSFENDKIGCDCQVWPEHNSFEPYQLNNPCLAYPITTTAAATCTYV